MARFKTICNGYGVHEQNISVFATEAMRTAKNKDEMLGAIKTASGLVVDILSPGMESMFGAMGARSGFEHVDGLFMDLGGGSVQMTYVNSSAEVTYDILAAEAAKSMPFGAAKLTEVLASKDNSHEAKKELRATMKETFEGLVDRFPKLKEQAQHDHGITIYFCGGGFRGYGSMLMHTDPIQPYPIPAIGGYSVPGDRFIKWREMLHANNYEEGKIFGMSKRRRQQFPAIVTVVQALVEAVPKVKQVVFCSGGNREGVLYMKLPPHVRESNPLDLLPGGYTFGKSIIEDVTGILTSCLTPGYPNVFGREILNYVSKQIWLDMGDPDDANSAKALHNPISGPLAGLPGMTHEIRAILALILCSRWGSDLSPGDKRLAENLQALIGHELSWWCQYIGSVARCFATVVPAPPSSEKALNNIVLFHPSTSHGLGKKGHKVGIRLKIDIAASARNGLAIGSLEDLFSKVGKGLKIDWKVVADVAE